MKPSPQAVVTRRRIRRHNLRCFGRMILRGLGAGSVFLILFLFVWLLASMLTGRRELGGPVVLGGVVFGAAFFLAGRRHLKKTGPLDWERIAQAPVRTPGMRISTRRNFDYARTGEGIWTLLLNGPGWLGKIADEWQALIPAREEIAARLEVLRRHLAARESWEPLRDFSSHEEDLYLLAKLEMLSIREINGQWYFHVTLEGSALAPTAPGKVAGKVEKKAAVEIDT